MSTKHVQTSDATITKETQDLLKLSQKNIPTSKDKTLTEATILEVEERTVLLSTGAKADSVLSINEFKNASKLKAGDKIEVYVEKEEDRHGKHVISHKKAQELRAWKTIEDAYHSQQNLMGTVKGKVKGGLEVEINGITTFLPGSQIGTSPTTDSDALLGQSIEVAVLSIKPDKKNAVISRRILLEKEQKSLIENLEEGQILEGKVRNITNFGVFVELAAGIVGLVYVKETVWDKRVTHPEQAKNEKGEPLFTIGEPVKVVVKGFEAQQDNILPRISLSTKTLLPNPWDDLPENFEEGAIIKGKVTTIKERGICVQVHDGIEGFVSLSEMSLSPYIQNPEEIFKTGEEVKLQILKINREEQDLRLTRKPFLDNPWEDTDFPDNYGLNTQHKATVRKYAEKNKGTYLEIKPGIEGYLDNDHISWTKKIVRANEHFKIGETHNVIVLGVNEEAQLLKFGMRELQDSPWDSFQGTFTIGSEHEAIVKTKYHSSAILELPYGLQTLTPNKDLYKEDKSPLKEGEILKVRILDFIKYDHKIVASHVATYKEVEQERVTPKNIVQKVQKTTLSDLTSLNELKEKLTENTKEDNEDSDKK